MIKYTVAMSVRMVCIVLGVFSQGWLMWVFFALALFLTYFAVIIANAQGPDPKQTSSNLIAPILTISSQDIKIADDK